MKDKVLSLLRAIESITLADLAELSPSPRGAGAFGSSGK